MTPACRRCGHAPLPGHQRLTALPRARRSDRQQHECPDRDACDNRLLVDEHYRLESRYRDRAGLGPPA